MFLFFSLKKVVNNESYNFIFSGHLKIPRNNLTMDSNNSLRERERERERENLSQLKVFLVYEITKHIIIC